MTILGLPWYGWLAVLAVIPILVAPVFYAERKARERNLIIWWKISDRIERQELLEKIGFGRDSSMIKSSEWIWSEVDDDVKEVLIPWVHKNPNQIPACFDIWVFKEKADRNNDNLEKGRVYSTAYSFKHWHKVNPGGPGYHGYTVAGTTKVVSFEEMMNAWGEKVIR